MGKNNLRFFQHGDHKSENFLCCIYSDRSGRISLNFVATFRDLTSNSYTLLSCNKSKWLLCLNADKTMTKGRKLRSTSRSTWSFSQVTPTKLWHTISPEMMLLCLDSISTSRINLMRNVNILKSL